MDDNPSPEDVSSTGFTVEVEGIVVELHVDAFRLSVALGLISAGVTSVTVL